MNFIYVQHVPSDLYKNNNNNNNNTNYNNNYNNNNNNNCNNIFHTRNFPSETSFIYIHVLQKLLLISFQQNVLTLRWLDPVFH